MKLTDWYPPQIKPVRQGVYITREKGNIYFQNWTGHYWNVRMSNIKLADEVKQRSQHQDVYWKGMTR